MTNQDGDWQSLGSIVGKLADSIAPGKSESPPPRSREAEPRRGASPWTEERIELLKKYWAEGLSCRWIAAEMTTPYISLTRSAIIGKVHRLGLPGRVVNHTTGSAPKRPRAHKARRPRAAVALDSPVLEAAPLPTENPEAIPLEQRKTLFELGNNHCRYPYGEPGTASFFFCGSDGANFREGQPYCSGHALLCFKPYVDKRRPARRIPTKHFKVPTNEDLLRRYGGEREQEEGERVAAP